MFVIDGLATFGVSDGGPRNWERLEAEGDCRFMSENRRWDVGDRESVAKAIGLYEIAPTDSVYSANERWLKRRAREYCVRGRLTLTADPD
jgi:hypothetical protein